MLKLQMEVLTPDFTAPDQFGTSHTLSTILASGKNVIIDGLDNSIKVKFKVLICIVLNSYRLSLLELNCHLPN